MRNTHDYAVLGAFPNLALLSMPTYYIWNATIIIAAVLLCWLPVVFGGLKQIQQRCKDVEPRLPSIPLFPGSSFPNIFDTLGALLAFMLIACASFFNDDGNGTSTISVSVMVISCLGMLVFYLPFIIRLTYVTGCTNEMGLHRPTPMRSRLLPAIPVVFLTIAFNVFFEESGCLKAIAESSGSELIQDSVKMVMMGDWTTRSYVIIQALIIAPIGEECLFRGFLFNIIRDKWGTIAGAAISSLAFASVHFSLPQFIPLFILALLQCRLYMKTRTLVAPILVHFIFNAISVMAAILLS